MKGLIAAIHFAVALLLAPYVFGQTFEVPQYLRTPEFHKWFDEAKVGDRKGYSTFDGCNSCSGEVVKVSDKSVRDEGTFMCTLRMCNAFGPEIKVKP